MRGPNYWSDIREQLIVVKIELREADLLSPAALAAIGQKLPALKPSLYNLRFYKSTLDLVAQAAVEIQCLAGMDCVYTKIHPTANPRIANICFSYAVERAGIYAAKAAVNLINTLVADQKYALQRDIHNLKRIQQRYSLDAEIQSFLDHAQAHNIPVKRLDKHSILLGHGAKRYIYPVGDDHLPDERNIGRIPIVAVTGTNGKTTTTRLIAHFAKVGGYRVGFTTTDGIYLQDELVMVGDCSGPLSAAVVLKDPEVNFAVLECARGGILRAGLAFDQCQISIVTNISKDHLGMDDIETLEELAKVKLTVAKTTARDGYAILNADDDLVYAMKESLQCNIALFSMNPGSQRVISHCQRGNLAAVLENGFFTIYKGRKKIKVANLKNVPLCHDGKAECMMQNVLPALLAGYLQNISVDNLRFALRKFYPSPEHTPGRMNIFNFDDFSLMIDYAHNEGGYSELKKYTDQLKVSMKVGVIAAVADRTDNDIINLGRLTAEIFDEIVIRHDAYNNGRTIEELNQLLIQGIREVKPQLPVKVISNEFEAIKYVITHAKKDAWIFVNSENVYDTIFYVSNFKTTPVKRLEPPFLQRRIAL